MPSPCYVVSQKDEAEAHPGGPDIKSPDMEIVIVGSNVTAGAPNRADQNRGAECDCANLKCTSQPLHATPYEAAVRSSACCAAAAAPGMWGAHHSCPPHLVPAGMWGGMVVFRVQNRIIGVQPMYGFLSATPFGGIDLRVRLTQLTVGLAGGSALEQELRDRLHQQWIRFGASPSIAVRTAFGKTASGQSPAPMGACQDPREFQEHPSLCCTVPNLQGTDGTPYITVNLFYRPGSKEMDVSERTIHVCVYLDYCIGSVWSPPLGRLGS